MLGKSSESEVSERLYDLIYQLNQISSNVLLSVLPQLEFKLKVWFVIYIFTQLVNVVNIELK
jgi:hypothetical protein